MYEYIIPQEFNQSDRFGPFTLQQLAILASAILISLFILTSGLPFFIALIIALALLGGALYVMYKKVNGIPIYEFAFVFMIFKATPKLLIYRADNIKDEYFEDDLILFDIEDEEN